MDSWNLIGIRGSVEIENRLRQKLADKLQADKNAFNSTIASKVLNEPPSIQTTLNNDNKAYPSGSTYLKSAVFKKTNDVQHESRSSLKSETIPSTSSTNKLCSVVQVVKNTAQHPAERLLNSDSTNRRRDSGTYPGDRSSSRRELSKLSNTRNSRNDRDRDLRPSARPIYSGYDYSYQKSNKSDDDDDDCNSRRSLRDSRAKAARCRSPLSPARRTQPKAPVEEKTAANKKEIPEHIKWLHDRWSKYDNPTFFSKSNLRPVELNKKSKPDNTRHENDFNKWQKEKRDPKSQSSDKVNAKISALKSDYIKWRYGGVDRDHLPHLLSFKEFLLSIPEDIDDGENEQQKAINMYTEYKLNFRRRAYREFFECHKDEEWFLEKYHPVYKAKREEKRRAVVQKRLDVFMFLLIRGWIETHAEYTDSRKVRKLLDAACVMLQDGKESDIMLLSDFDYVLEEKRELSYDIAREKEEKDELESKQASEVDSSSKENPSKGDAENGDLESFLEKEKEAEETKKNEETALEVAQHALDYSKFVTARTENVAFPSLEANSLPHSLPKVQISSTHTETRYIGDGVFVVRPRLILEDNSTPLSDTILHRSLSLCIRDISPKVSREELQNICTTVHGGFIRLYMSDPDPERCYHRQAIASFWANSNMTKILWNLRARKFHDGQLLNVLEYRDFSKRIELIDGLASDKSIVLRDIQLCKSLIEFLDQRHNLWSEPAINPLLVNLDQCLTFHLQQLIESGEVKDLADVEATTAEATEPAKTKSVGRDENLIKILDRLILYLRIVHSVDYYGCKFHESEDDEPKRIGQIHLRGPCHKQATPKQLADHIRSFEENLQRLLPNESKLAEEHVELLGKRSMEEEEQQFIVNNVVTVQDGLSKCCLCYKRFTSVEFAKAHFTRHYDLLERHKAEAVAFHNYLYDPNRLCHVQFNV